MVEEMRVEDRGSVVRLVDSSEELLLSAKVCVSAVSQCPAVELSLCDADGLWLYRDTPSVSASPCAVDEEYKSAEAVWL